jgi:hypothetical protein
MDAPCGNVGESFESGLPTRRSSYPLRSHPVMDLHLISPIVFAALVAWGIYRRMRRTFGRQTIDLKRIQFRIAFLALVGVLAAINIVHDARTLGGLIGGIACGAALAHVGLRHTKFETTAEGSFYTPHTYIGVVVAALLLGRLLYRIFLFNAPHGMAAANQSLAVVYQNSPLTAGTFGALISYYVLYYVGVIVKSRAPALPVEPNRTD